MFNRTKFKALLIMKGKTMQNIADLLGINQATLYRKVNGSSDFFRCEIELICKCLEIDDPKDIFFTQDITETQNHQRKELVFPHSNGLSKE